MFKSKQMRNKRSFFFRGKKQGLGGFSLKQTKTNQKQTKTPKRTTKEGLWPSEVALRVTSPDP